jgi:transcriptional regulator with PAS, ATPase and Fis domain
METETSQGDTGKRLVVISGSETARRELASQMEELFDGRVAIESFALNSGIPRKIERALVLVTSTGILEKSRPFIGDSCRVMIGRRTLNFAHLDKLYSIPQDSSLLIVNASRQTADAVIQQLQEIGFINFHYHAYFPGSTVTRDAFDFVITPGETRLVPEGHRNVIDIGPRIFHVTTIIEAVKALDMLDAGLQEKINSISSSYMRKIISLGQELNVKHENLKLLNEFLLKIINSVNDGILVYSRSGTIELMNHIASQILHLGEGDNILSEAKAVNPSLHGFLHEEALEHRIVQLEELTYLFSKSTTASSESYLLTIKNVRERINMENQLKKELKKQGYRAKYTFSDLVHRSTVMKELILKGRKLGESEFNILIQGESGTGKELFASAMHNASKRKNGPFFAVNCSALPDELIESELFGYEEGAFTGAKRGGKTGLFELAHQGTLFLDEIGDISPKIQSRLLRVLQEKEVLRVGGTKNIPVDVRVIAATNKDLSDMVKRGSFREDLYYRLNKLYVQIPPLRERREDIELLFRHFLVQKNGFDLKLMEDARSVLVGYEWPGNVRELENNVEYILAIREQDWIDRSTLSEHLLKQAPVVHDPDGALVLSILRAIGTCNRQGTPIGRIRLLEVSRSAHPGLSEPQIRKVLGWLAAKGLVQVSRGRAGLRLTGAGEAHLGSGA